LSLATPVAYTIAATTLRKQGIVVSNGAFLERLAGITSVAFDKTGTLTEGNLQIAETLLLDTMSQDQVLNLAASLEKTSKHPIASAFGEGRLEVEAREIIPGSGVKGVIEDTEYRLGKASFVVDDQLSNPDNVGMWVLLAGDKPLAWFRFEDSPRKEAGDTIRVLRSLGCEPSILTGDQSRQGIELGLELGIEDVRTGLSPADKVDILSQKQQKGERILMVGDGINDTAAMGIADVSVAVSPVDVFVQSSADATLLSNNLGTLVVAVKYARRVRRIIAENISWAVAYNLCVIPLAVTGTIEPWMAALGMSFSSVMVVLNANRLVRVL
jgi:Cu2+-exporting ATPase